MGIQERKQREREQRREAIIEAASQVFIRKGLNGTTMDEIAAKAELSKATLYLYFANKEELFLAVLVIVSNVFCEVMASGQSEGKDVLTNLHALGESYISFYRQYPAYYKLLNSLEPSDETQFEKYSTGHELAEANARIWKIVCAPIVQGVQMGVFKADTNPLEIGMTLWMGSTGIINLMDHVQRSAHHKEIHCELPEDSTLGQIACLRFERMLEELWISVIQRIINE